MSNTNCAQRAWNSIWFAGGAFSVQACVHDESLVWCIITAVVYFVCAQCTQVLMDRIETVYKKHKNYTRRQNENHNNRL